MAKKVVNYSDFELIVSESIHIVNRRPIAFKEALRDNSASDYTPKPITPEMIVYGHELVSVNVLPVTEDEWRPPVSPVELFDNLSDIRRSLYHIYESGSC